MNNFTPRAQQVLALARKEAERFDHNYVGTEHLLLGLIKLGQGVAVNVLERMGVEISETRIEVEKQIGRGPDLAGKSQIPFTPRVKKVLMLSEKEAHILNHTYVGTEHLLLGLLKEGGGTAARVLQNLNVDIEHTRHEILSEIDPNFDADADDEEDIFEMFEDTGEDEKPARASPIEIAAKSKNPLLKRKAALIQSLIKMKVASINEQDFDLAAAYRDKEKTEKRRLDRLIETVAKNPTFGLRQNEVIERYSFESIGSKKIYFRDKLATEVAELLANGDSVFILGKKGSGLSCFSDLVADKLILNESNSSIQSFKPNHIALRGKEENKTYEECLEQFVEALIFERNCVLQMPSIHKSLLNGAYEKQYSWVKAISDLSKHGVSTMAWADVSGFNELSKKFTQLTNLFKVVELPELEEEEGRVLLKHEIALLSKETAIQVDEVIIARIINEKKSSYNDYANPERALRIFRDLVKNKIAEINPFIETENRSCPVDYVIELEARLREFILKRDFLAAHKVNIELNEVFLHLRNKILKSKKIVFVTEQDYENLLGSYHGN
mgnify:CR=1 FL=1